MGVSGNKCKNVDETYIKKRYNLESDMGKMIFSGPRSQVFEAFDKNNNNLKVAIKKITKDMIKKNSKNAEYEKKYIDSIKNEANLLDKCKSAYTIKLYDLFETEDSFYLIMEYCQMNLYSYLHEYGNRGENGLPVKEIQEIFKKLNIVFNIMDNKDIVHRDIKPQNILINISEKGEVTPKLCDFGIGRETKKGMCSTLGVGTLGYMAPEIMEDGDNGKGEYYGSSADLWSIGIVLYELCKKDRPYEGEARVALKKQINRNERSKIYEDKDLENLVSQLLQPEQKKRIKYKEYFIHPFWKGKK